MKVVSTMGMLKNVDDRHKTIYRAVILIVSSLLYSVSMNIFVEYGNLFPGGTAGISRLLYQLANMVNIPLTFSPIYFALNIIIAVLFAKPLGKHFTSYTVVWFTLTSIFTAVLPKIQLTDEIILAAKNYDPAKITRYAITLATLFHKFYNACKIGVDDEPLMQARLHLCMAVQSVMHNVLTAFKITVPESM